MGEAPYIAGETIEANDAGVIQLGKQTSDNTFQIISSDNATEATLALIKTALDAIDSNTSDVSTETTLALIKTAIDTINTNTTDNATETTLDSLLTNTTKKAPPELQHLGLTQTQIDGIVPGFVLGHNLAIDSANLQDVTTFGEAFITQPTSNTDMEIVSTSVQDDSAGTGARKIEISGIADVAGVWTNKVQTVTMNGTTAVTVDDSAQTINFLKITQIHTIEPAPTNSQHTAVGDITLEAVGGGTVYGKIDAGGNMELACRVTIPDGFKGYFTRWSASAGKVPSQGDEIAFFLRATADPDTRELLTNVFIFHDIMHLTANSSENSILPLPFPARCEIKVSAMLNGNSSAIGSASFQGWLVPDA